MKNLIVTADDFGMSKSINEGIARAYTEGIVTFISFMPSGEAFEDALRLAKDLKLEEMGAHLALSETAPVTDAARIPTLTARGGRFYPHHNEFLLKFFLKRIDPEEAYLELKNQLERLRKLNIRITNLSSHEHIHMIPGILAIFVRLAKEYNIPSIRYPRGEKMPGDFDIAKLYRFTVLSYFEKSMWKILRTTDLAYADRLAGFLYSGKLYEDALVGIIDSLEDGTSELVCHPGLLGPEVRDRYRWHLGCETELAALTSRHVKKAIEDKGINLTAYKAFLSGRGR